MLACSARVLGATIIKGIGKEKWATKEKIDREKSGKSSDVHANCNF